LQTNRQDRLQYTVPQLARSVMTDLLGGEETGDVYNRFNTIPALDIQK